MMVLLQLYMHEGGYCRNKHVGDYLDYFKKAEQVAKDIMDLQYYELQAEFKDIWSPQNQHNNEIIFALPSFPIPVMGNNFLAHVLPTDYKSQQGIPLTGWNGSEPRGKYTTLSIRPISADKYTKPNTGMGKKWLQDVPELSNMELCL